MLGNVWEWCEDFYRGYPTARMVSPTGPTTGTNRLVRGGSWYYKSSYCRGSQRNDDNSDDADSVLGFRAVRTP